MENIEKLEEDTLLGESFERMQFPTGEEVEESVARIEELQESFDEVIGSSDEQKAEAYWMDYINSLAYEDILEEIDIDNSDSLAVVHNEGVHDISETVNDDQVEDSDQVEKAIDPEEDKDGMEASEKLPLTEEVEESETAVTIGGSSEVIDANRQDTNTIDKESFKYFDDFIRWTSRISSIVDRREENGLHLLDFMPFKESLRIFKEDVEKEDIDMESLEESIVGMTDALSFDIYGEVDGSKDSSDDLQEFVSCASNSIYYLSLVRDRLPEGLGGAISSLMEALDYKIKTVKRLERENMERYETYKSIRYMIDSPMESLLRVLKYVDEEGAIFDMRTLKSSVEQLSDSVYRNDKEETLSALSRMRKSMEIISPELPPSVDPDEVYRIITQLDDLHYGAVSAASKSMDAISDALKGFSDECWDAMESLNHMKSRALDKLGR
jgi:hypothetical protein